MLATLIAFSITAPLAALQFTQWRRYTRVRQVKWLEGPLPWLKPCRPHVIYPQSRDLFSRRLQHVCLYGPLYLDLSSVTRLLHRYLRPFTTNGALFTM